MGIYMRTQHIHENSFRVWFWVSETQTRNPIFFEFSCMGHGHASRLTVSQDECKFGGEYGCSCVCGSD